MRSETATRGAPWGSPRRTALVDRSLQIALVALGAGFAVAGDLAQGASLAWGAAGAGIAVIHALGRAPRAAALLALGLAAAGLASPGPPLGLALGAAVAAATRLALLQSPAGPWLEGVRGLARERRTALLATGLCTRRDVVRAGDHYEEAGRARRALSDLGVAVGGGVGWLRVGALMGGLLDATPGDALGAILDRWERPVSPPRSAP